MLLALLLLAAPPDPPAPPNRAEVNNAIWYDLELNAVIGNGNWIGALWYDGKGTALDSKADHHIRDLRCRMLGSRYRCNFTLLRDGGAVMNAVEEEMAPDILTCTADLRFNDTDKAWTVFHKAPPRHGGHSRTTMHCHKPGE